MAKELAPIVAPTAYVTPASAYPVPPPPRVGGMCPVPKTDWKTGVFRFLGKLMHLKEGSPALIGEPVYVSGSTAKTVWGLGWVSDNDQTITLNSDRSVTWTDGSGAQTIFSNVNLSTASVPILIAPKTVYSSMTVVSVSGVTPTAISEREKDGTVQLFTVLDSTSVLRLSRLTDRNGNFLDYARDAQGRLTKVTDIHGRYFTMTYNAAGYVSQIADSGGRTSTYLYDSRGHRLSESGPAGTTAYAYDAQGRLVKVTHPNGGITEYTYDSQNRVLTEDNGAGNDLLTYSYGPNSTIVTDALGRKTVLEYQQIQGLKQLTRLTDPDGNVVTFTYDAAFNLASQTDPLGRVTHLSYDALGNVTSVQDAAGGTTDAAYDPAFSEPTTLTDPMGNTTGLKYDASGNLTQVVDPLSNTVSFSYDSFGHATQSQDALGHLTQFTFDPSNGALASITDPLNRKVMLQTDSLSRVTKLTDPAGNATQYAYDAASDLTQVTDALGGITQFTYAPGRQAKLLSSIKDPLNHTTSMAYDPQGRLTSVTNALNQSGMITYDAKSRISSVRTRNGQTITMSYDTLDRLTGVASPVDSRTLAYDAAGNLTSVNAPNGSGLSFSYDSLNRVAGLTETLDDGFSDSPSFAYDANGNRTSMTSQLGSYTYGYDALNRLTSLSGAPGVFGISYDAAGRPAALTYPNGVKASFSYDAAGQTLRVLHQRTTDQATVASISYAYDANGNRTAVLDQAGTHSFTYDALNRLTSATHPVGSGLATLNETFAFDAIGNRTADAQRTGYQYDAANRIVSDSSFTYTSDANGNRTSQTSRATGQTTTFKYDSGSSLTEVDGPGGGVVAAYKYDPQRRRIAKTVGGVVTRFIYDGFNVRAILDGNSNAIAKFLYVPGMPAPLAMQVLVSTQDFVAGTYFLHNDALGSVVALTDAAGNLVETYEYESFGRVVVRDAQGGLHDRSTVGNPFMYAGTFYDPETGFYQMGFRYQDPDTGRFLEEDPLGFAGGDLTLHSYALNRPVVGVDPLGLEVQLGVAAGGSAGAWFLGFYGISLGGGVTSGGRFYGQLNLSIEIGAGEYGGVGVQGGVAKTKKPLPGGWSVDLANQTDVNVELGPISAGGTVSESNGDYGLSSSIPRIGLGEGVQASSGKALTITYALPSWPWLGRQLTRFFNYSDTCSTPKQRPGCVNNINCK